MSKPSSSDAQTVIGKKAFFQKHIFGGNKKNFGSILTMVIGLGLVGSVASGSNQPTFGDVGWAMILGGLVCYSAKRTRLGLAKPSTLRQTLEILGLILALFLSHTISGDGLSIIVALWIVTAYLVIKFKKSN